MDYLTDLASAAGLVAVLIAVFVAPLVAFGLVLDGVLKRWNRARRLRAERRGFAVESVPRAKPATGAREGSGDPGARASGTSAS